MKKNLLLLTLAFVVCLFSAKAGELTIINGTPQSNSTHVPINSPWVDTQNTFAQCIFPASLLGDMNDCTITAIKFYVKSDTGIPFYGCTLQFSLGETEQTAFDSPVEITGLTPVATMSFPEADPTATELLITFDTPYEYHGGNLVFESKVTTAGTWKYVYFLGQNQSTNTAYTGNNGVQTFLPMTTFTYETGEVPSYAATVTPATLDFGATLLNTENVLNVTIQNKGANAFTPALSELTAPFSTDWVATEIAAGQSATVPVKFTPTELVAASGTLTIDCGEAGTFEVALSGYGDNSVQTIVCEGINTNSFIPFYGYWSDMYPVKSQMIYPAELLESIKGQKITGVTFFNKTTLHFTNTNVQLSATETEQSIFEKENANALPNMIADMTVVANTTTSAQDNEMVFTLAEPFVYSGGNLALEVYGVELSSEVTLDQNGWLGINYSDDLTYSCYTYSNRGDVKPFLPKVQFTTVASEEPQPVVKLGDVNDDGEVDLNDLTVLINYLLDKNPSPFNFDNANVNETGEVDLNDLTALINMLLAD